MLFIESIVDSVRGVLIKSYGQYSIHVIVVTSFWIVLIDCMNIHLYSALEAKEILYMQIKLKRCDYSFQLTKNMIFMLNEYEIWKVVEEIECRAHSVNPLTTVRNLINHRGNQKLLSTNTIMWNNVSSSHDQIIFLWKFFEISWKLHLNKKLDLSLSLLVSWKYFMPVHILNLHSNAYNLPDLQTINTICPNLILKLRLLLTIYLSTLLN